MSVFRARESPLSPRLRFNGRAWIILIAKLVRDLHEGRQLNADKLSDIDIPTIRAITDANARTKDLSNATRTPTTIPTVVSKGNFLAYYPFIS